MIRKDILAARQAAERFAKVADQLLLEIGHHPYSSVICGTKVSGQCRRSSMDLTRSLATMRNTKRDY